MHTPADNRKNAHNTLKAVAKQIAEGERFLCVSVSLIAFSRVYVVD
jgi:hypothetical protein